MSFISETEILFLDDFFFASEQKSKMVPLCLGYLSSLINLTRSIEVSAMFADIALHCISKVPRVQNNYEKYVNVFYMTSCSFVQILCLLAAIEKGFSV